MSLRRIKKEFALLQKDPIENCSAGIKNNNYYNWEATILGPSGTPYEGGVFQLHLSLPQKYPLVPPQVRFDTKIFHPNIDSEGGICLDILKGAWSPVLGISKILLSICSLLNDPNPEDPLVPYIATLYKKNIESFNMEAKNWTSIYATDLLK